LVPQINALSPRNIITTSIDAPFFTSENDEEVGGMAELESDDLPMFPST